MIVMIYNDSRGDLRLWAWWFTMMIMAFTMMIVMIYDDDHDENSNNNYGFVQVCEIYIFSTTNPFHIARYDDGDVGDDDDGGDDYCDKFVILIVFRTASSFAY